MSTVNREISKPSQRQAQADATRARLVGIARRLFAEHGYADTPIDAIVNEAGITRGALYYHFEDKKALLEAAYCAIEEELVAAVGAAAMADPDAPIDMRLERAIREFLQRAAEPEVQRIVVRDVPAILGVQRWRELDDRYGRALLRATLEQGIAEGAFAPVPVEPIVSLVLAALNEAATEVASSDDTEAAIEEMTATVMRLLSGLRA
jgi:AcrR family transcriptional regulator